MRQYAFKITWYSYYDECNHDDCGVLIAENFNDAMNRMYERFPTLINISLHESFEGDEFIFLTPEMYMDYVNNNYSFVNWANITDKKEGDK